MPYIARALYVGNSGTLEISGANDYDVLGIQAAAVSASADTIAIPGHGFKAGDRVMLYGESGSLPAGLAAQTAYYVRYVNANTIQLSATSGGSAIDITATTGVTGFDVFKTSQLQNVPGSGAQPLCVKRVAALHDLHAHRRTGLGKTMYLGNPSSKH